MKIRLKSFFHLDMIKAFGQEQISLEEGATLKTLLQEMTKKSEGTIALIDLQRGRINDEYFVLVNGRDFQALPQGLETELTDSDEVGIGWVDILFSGG